MQASDTQHHAAQLLQSLALGPQILALLEQQARELAALRAEVARNAAPAVDSDGWLDSKAAAKYLSLSPGSFDKYRYKTTPRIPGYQLDGKTLYKKADLDNFVRLYEVKSNGLA